MHINNTLKFKYQLIGFTLLYILNCIPLFWVLTLQCKMVLTLNLLGGNFLRLQMGMATIHMGCVVTAWLTECKNKLLYYYNVTATPLPLPIFASIILCMCPANERWCYTVTPSLIGWAHTQNAPCICSKTRDQSDHGNCIFPSGSSNISRWSLLGPWRPDITTFLTIGLVCSTICNYQMETLSNINRYGCQC